MNSKQQFEEIYIKYSDKIYRYVYLNLNDPYLAEDIVSEVFLRLWKKWKTIRLDFIQALLYKIAKNIIVDYYRKQKISLLPQNLREVLILRFIEEMPAREVGKILDTTEVNIRVLQYRAIQK